MADKKVLTIGALIFIIMSGIFYVQFQDVKIRVDDDQTTFYRPNLDYPWIWSVTGRETNQLFDGSSLMNRDRSSIRVN